MRKDAPAIDSEEAYRKLRGKEAYSVLHETTQEKIIRYFHEKQEIKDPLSLAVGAKYKEVIADITWEKIKIFYYRPSVDYDKKGRKVFGWRKYHSSDITACLDTTTFGDDWFGDYRYKKDGLRVAKLYMEVYDCKIDEEEVYQYPYRLALAGN